MAKTFISPSKYIQGPGEILNLGTYAKLYGTNPLVLISPSGHKRSGAEIEAGFSKENLPMNFDYFNGECSKNEIDRISAIIKGSKNDVVIAVGGGKILDTAKAVAYYNHLPVIVCPTAASTDAPCSALSVLYTDNGEFDEYLFLPENPNIVLMDTTIVTKSPVRLTVSGMGDALATYFEMRACANKDANNFANGKAPEAAKALAKLCFDLLMSEGVKAKIALEAGACTASVEKVVEANTLLSGIGFESGGIAAAHAIHNGFTVLEECHHMYHGEKVAFGVVSQLMLEDASVEELNQIYDFCISVGLPVTFEQLGIKEVTTEKIMKVATLACAENDTLHNMPFAVSPESVYAAMMAANAYGHKRLGK